MSILLTILLLVLHTPRIIYEGGVDEQHLYNGYGQLRTTGRYQQQQQLQGVPRSKILVWYRGNFHQGRASGLGLAKWKDGHQTYGYFRHGRHIATGDGTDQTADAVYGIDISHFQNQLYWDGMGLDQHPIQFVFMKASEGQDIIDTSYIRYAQQARLHHMVFGPYHFFHLTSAPRAQAENFIRQIRKEEALYPHSHTHNLPPALDLENDREMCDSSILTVRNKTYEWLAWMEQLYGVRPIIYTREDIYQKYLKGDPRFHRYAYWIAIYRPEGPQHMAWDFWQTTCRGVVLGNSGPFDINKYRGNYREFYHWISCLPCERK